MLCATPAVPTQTFFRLRINPFLVGKISLLFHQDCALLHVDSLSRYDEITVFRSNLEAMRF